MAVFIPCASKTQALYRRTADTGEAVAVLGVPVEAWDETGQPYVAGKNKLVLASSFQDNRLTFLRLSGEHTWTGEPGKEPARFSVPDDEVALP